MGMCCVHSLINIITHQFLYHDTANILDHLGMGAAHHHHMKCTLHRVNPGLDMNCFSLESLEDESSTSESDGAKGDDASPIST